MSDLPIIDLGPLLNKSRSEKNNNDASASSKTEDITPEQKELAKQIRNACKNHGFFYICNHGVDEGLMRKTMQSARELFLLPEEEKVKISSKNNPLFRGYISTSDGLHTCNSKKKKEVGLDQKESFTLGAEAEGPFTSPMHGPNQWPCPESLPNFRDTVEEYWNAQLTLCRVIARGLSLSLGLDQNFFEHHLSSPVAQMVLLSYPPPPCSLDDTVCRTKHTGCGEHTDCGFLTILTQDSPGLEVKDPQTDEWKPVKVLENMFVVNLGDMAARWTNDAYKSTKHRVYNQNDSIRYSIPFFCNCNFEAPVKCILTDDDSCDKGNDKADGSAKYEETTAGAYIMERLGFMRK